MKKIFFLTLSIGLLSITPLVQPSAAGGPDPIPPYFKEPLYGKNGTPIKQVVAYLNQNPANINSTELFTEALKNCRPDIVDLLLAKRADPKALTPDGDTYLHVIASQECRGQGEGLLSIAEKLIDTYGLDVNAISSGIYKYQQGATPLSNAIDYHNEGMVKLLLERKADLSIQGMTALEYAEKQVERLRPRPVQQGKKTITPAALSTAKRIRDMIKDEVKRRSLPSVSAGAGDAKGAEEIKQIEAVRSQAGAPGGPAFE